MKKYKIDWERKVSKPQKAVKDFLFQFWENDVVYEEAYIPGSKKRIDLWNESHKVMVEVSPDAVHTKYNPFMHGNRVGFWDKLQTDNKKHQWAEKNGYTFVILNDADIKNISVELFQTKFGVTL